MKKAMATRDLSYYCVAKVSLLTLLLKILIKREKKNYRGGCVSWVDTAVASPRVLI